MPQHVPISSPFQVCFSVGARVGRGGAIYQNVSPLVSANGRRTPTDLPRAITTLGRKAGRQAGKQAERREEGGRVPLSKLRMQVTHRPTDRRPDQKRVLRNLLRRTEALPPLPLPSVSLMPSLTLIHLRGYARKGEGGEERGSDLTDGRPTTDDRRVAV